MSAKDAGRALLSDNTEELVRDYRPAWAVEAELPAKELPEDGEASDEADEVAEEIQATLQKTAYGDYIAQVPLSEGQYATIGVQQTRRKDAFDGAKDVRAAASATRRLGANLAGRIVLCVVVFLIVAVAASVIGTAIVNDITIKEAVSVFLQGFTGK